MTDSVDYEIEFDEKIQKELERFKKVKDKNDKSLWDNLFKV